MCMAAASLSITFKEVREILALLRTLVDEER